MSIQSKIQFLMQVAKIPPEAWDFFFPHGPAIKSHALKEYIMAGVVRDIAYQINDRKIAYEVKSAGAEMIKFAAANLINGWEDGDDLCPLWPPIPIPYPRFDYFKPQPDPWFNHDIASLNPQPLPPKSLASALKLIGRFTSLENVSEQLKELGARMEYETDIINNRG